jgi:selenocysteine lyase/cysteine desulfurase
MAISPPHNSLLAYRAQFPSLTRCTYLNACNVGPLSLRVKEAQLRYLEQWEELGGQAWFAPDGWWPAMEHARHRFAALIGAAPHEVALAPNVSTALSVIASALDYRKRTNVVLTDMDFPTLPYQWLVKERRLGVECRFVESPDRIATPPELFEQVVDDKTALVATSRVFYTSGYIQDIPAIAAIAHKHGAYVLVDDYQATGQVPIDVREGGVDFLVTGTLKWLLGGPGLAFVYIREGVIPSLEPMMAGWFGNRDQLQLRPWEFTFRPDAARTELGTPSIGAVFAACAALDLMHEIGVERIRERISALTADLTARALARGWKVRAADDPAQRSAIVSLDLHLSEAAVKDLVQRLCRECAIICDARATPVRGGTSHRTGGVIRLAPHFYNTADEMEAVVEALAERLP